MSREWGLFWLAMAIMVLSGSIIATGFLGKGFNVGSVGQWASAIGTVTAVWVALRNTHLSLSVAEERENLRQKKADHAFISTVTVLTSQIDQAMTLLHDSKNGQVISPVFARDIVARTNMKGAIAALDRLPLHLAPETFYIGTYDNVRACTMHVIEKLEAISKGSKGGVLDISQEFKGLKATVRILKDKLAHDGIPHEDWI